LAHFAQKGTASGTETSNRSIPDGFPQDGRRAMEEVRPHRRAPQELGVQRRLHYKWRDQLEPIEDGEGHLQTPASVKCGNKSGN
jgi:hypothetical protein